MNIDIESEVKKLVRKNIMQEINGLGLRAAIRQEIEASGITKENVKELVKQSVDSYVRSANVAELTENYINKLIAEMVKKEINKYIEVSCFGANAPRETLRDAIKQELFRQFRENYSLSVKVDEVKPS